MPSKIPTKLTDNQRELLVQNVLTVYNAATPQQVQAGARWYQHAHDLAVFLADSEAPGPIRQMAGVIAALSANKSWAQNVRLAQDAANGDVHGHTRVMLAKVDAILHGIDPEEVLPMALKTGAFFRCILDPSDPDAVVIDRHAHDVAVGEVYGEADRGLSVPTRYALLAHVYREAALRAGILPQQMQAITWVVQTQRLAGLGTRNDQHAPAS